MEGALRAELITPLVGLPVLPALLGTDAALIGAARLALDLVTPLPAARETDRRPT